MSKYSVNLAALEGHTLPPLLESFGVWLAKQEYGSLGHFGLQTHSLVGEEAAWPDWKPEAAARLQRDGFAFLRTPDGSELVLLKTGTAGPPAVVLLGSEGETSTVASSLEEFLLLLSKGETGLDDLDDEDAPGAAELASWLKRNKVKAPDAQSFDFTAYLDGTVAGPSAALAAAPVARVVAGLPPLIHRLVTLLGRRADDPELAKFCAETLGKKAPDATTDIGGAKNVVAKKQGLEMAFSHDVKNEKYPRLNKSKNSFVPYLTTVWLNKGVEALPFGLKFGMSAEEITSLLGPGTGEKPSWQRVLDPGRDLVLDVGLDSFMLTIDEACELASTRIGSPPLPVVGLFVAWALQRDLIDEARFARHAELLASIRQRERQGSALVAAASPVGLWDVHLRDVPGFRRFVNRWFKNIGRVGIFIKTDLIEVFGSRKGPTGHAEAILDDDDWKAVDQATPTLDKRFAEWVKPLTAGTPLPP